LWSNLITITLSSNVDLAKDSTITLSGLNGTLLPDDVSHPVTSNPADAFSSGVTLNQEPYTLNPKP